MNSSKGRHLAEQMRRLCTSAGWPNPLVCGRASSALRIQALARRVGRDVKGGHADAHALVDAGRIALPYDAIHVDFMLKAA